MGRLARGEYLDPQRIQIVHTTQRCVRRAFLCGSDPLTGKSFEHRRQWIRDRLEFLASVFGIDCLTFSVMNNHLHLILRSRPDVVRQWTDEQVARRWLRLFPRRRLPDGQPAAPDQAELNTLLQDPGRLAELRIRLSDISWWMRCTSEVIARQANREDQCRGHFWEGRFGAQMITDTASLLACAMYVDLNPIRAAMADTPEASRFTGAKERLDDWRQCTSTGKGTQSGRRNGKRPAAKQGSPDRTGNSQRWERRGQGLRSGWMSPLEINEQSDPVGADASANGRRASCKGFLPLSLGRYLQLLDWTGRQLRVDKRGAIPADLAPILQRLGLDAANWCDLVLRFGRLFKRVAGGPPAVAAEAKRRGQNWMQAPGAALLHAA